jgi:hypothetical protein
MTSNVTLDGYILSAILWIVVIGSMYFAGRIAKARGRSFKTWALIAGLLIGPLALPVLYVLPKLDGKDGTAT